MAANMVGPVGTQGTAARPQKNPFDMLINATGDGLHPAIDMLAKHFYGPKVQAAAQAQQQPIQQVQPTYQPQGYNPAGANVAAGGGGNPPPQTNPVVSRSPGQTHNKEGGSKFRHRFNQLFPFLLSQLEPFRMQSSEAAAIGGQTALQGAQAENARSGLGGSGFALNQEQGIRGGTQASIHEALTTMYEQALAEAIAGSYSKKKYHPPTYPHTTTADNVERIYNAYTGGGGGGGQ